MKMSYGTLTNEIAILSRDIQELDNQIIQLQLKRDDLGRRRAKLRDQRDKHSSATDIRNTELTLKMSMDMLGREVGLDDL